MPFIKEPMSITEAIAVCDRPISVTLLDMLKAPDFFMCDAVHALETAAKCLERKYLISPRIYLLEALVDVASKWGELTHHPKHRCETIVYNRSNLNRYLRMSDDCVQYTKSIATMLAIDESIKPTSAAYDKWVREICDVMPMINPSVWRKKFRPGFTLCLDNYCRDMAKLEAKNKALDEAARAAMQNITFGDNVTDFEFVMEMAREFVRGNISSSSNALSSQ